ncbi:hypothetical protein [Mangrovimonas sp. TPBH4]|uniref:TapB family protein n=1 Tax=Mangrovimonas sp. TPBH4 TaxID=1645914 RepID=UPI0006B4B650|nr:hypothetical protein [Mangrovimonas sp. TPBH4]
MIPFKPIFFIVIFLCALTINAQNNCSQYYPFKEGVAFELTKYDKHNKVETVTKTTVKSVQNNSNETIATLHTQIVDDKGKETVSTDYDMICDGNQVEIDMKELLRHTLASSTEHSSSNVETNITGTNSIMPNNLKTGQNLPDSIVEMEFKTESLNMTFSIKTENRKVLGTETITTPAGTFNCIVIEYETTAKVMITKHTKSKLWLAEGVGLVKEEEYNKNGKLLSSQVLTAFSS